MGKEEINKDWERGIIIQLLKKSDPTVCANYRSTTLLNVEYKILTTVINKKIERSFRKTYRRVPIWVQERKIHCRCHSHAILASREVLRTENVFTI